MEKRLEIQGERLEGEGKLRRGKKGSGERESERGVLSSWFPGQSLGHRRFPWGPLDLESLGACAVLSPHCWSDRFGGFLCFFSTHSLAGFCRLGGCC